MDKQSFPALSKDRWPISSLDIESRVGGILDSADFHESSVPGADTKAITQPKISKPISSIMEHNVSTVDSEDTVEKVEQVLATQGLSSVPVTGSNGEIVGIVGSQELTHFLCDKKNAKAVRAWEISRFTKFEVDPNDSIEDVAKLMAMNKFEYMAVTEHGELKGVVTMPDLVQVILNENNDEVIADDARHATAGEPQKYGRRHDD
jgi:predicted transcriptional regulator